MLCMALTRSVVRRAYDAIRYRIPFELRIACSTKKEVLSKGILRVTALGCSGPQLDDVLRLDENDYRDAWRLIQEELRLVLTGRVVRVYVIGQGKTRIGMLPRAIQASLRGVKGRAVWSSLYDAIFAYAASPRALARTLVHELCHVAFDIAGLRTAIPPAVSEGFAMAVEDRVCTNQGMPWTAWARKGYLKSRERGHLFEYTDLCQATFDEYVRMNRYRSAVFYAQSLLLVQFILATTGRSVGDLVSELRRLGKISQPPVSSVLAQACGLDVDCFAQQYFEYCDEVCGVPRRQGGGRVN